MFKELQVPPRTIMTPGPVEAYPLVLRAMAAPILGQFDPAFLAIMDETKEMIKVPFGTKISMLLRLMERHVPAWKQR